MSVFIHHWGRRCWLQCRQSAYFKTGRSILWNTVQPSSDRVFGSCFRSLSAWTSASWCWVPLTPAPIWVTAASTPCTWDWPPDRTWGPRLSCPSCVTWDISTFRWAWRVEPWPIDIFISTVSWPETSVRWGVCGELNHDQSIFSPVQCHDLGHQYVQVGVETWTMTDILPSTMSWPYEQYIIMRLPWSVSGVCMISLKEVGWGWVCVA